MATGPNQMGKLNPADLIDRGSLNIGGDTLRVGGDIAIPAADADVDELVGRWTRELARAARLPSWEPTPEPPGDTDTGTTPPDRQTDC